MGSNTPKLYESKLHGVWRNQDFTGSLYTESGLDVKILDIGIHNTDESGPDFKNARIVIGNITYVGDIEIDIEYSAWKSHGHNIDSKYNKVVLHGSLFNKFNQHYVYTKEGRKIPNVCLAKYVDQKYLDNIDLNDTVEPNQTLRILKCSDRNQEVSTDCKKEFIAELGIDRFKKKSQKIFNRLKELKFIDEMKLSEPVIKYDLNDEFANRDFTYEDFKDPELWEQLFYELIFEALGYSKNKSIMLKLAQSVDVKFLKQLGKREDKDLAHRIESGLFSVGGLTPELKQESSAYLINLKREWETLKRIYDGPTFNEADWHFTKLRPQNFPTVRVSGGTKLVIELLHNSLIPKMIKKISEIRNLTVLLNSLRSLFIVKSFGYWRTHYIFEKKSSSEIKYFIGASRAEEILVNVLLPYFYIYFEVFGNEELSKKVIKLYNVCAQRSDNKIVRDVSTGLCLEEFAKKTMYSQGMIELFRSYCSKGKCLECNIGKVVFN